jgi:hypothetical protein
MELPAGADGKLGEHLAQVVLNGAGADEQAGTNLRVRQTLSGQPGDPGLLAVSGPLAGPGGVRAGWAVRAYGAVSPVVSSPRRARSANAFIPIAPSIWHAMRNWSRASAIRRSQRSHPP